MKNDSNLPIRCVALKKLRKDNKKTQGEMAELLGVTEKTYRSWEKGEYRKDEGMVYPEPGLDKIIKIAENFQCSVDYVLGRSDCKTVENDFISRKTGLSEKAINALNYTFTLKRKDVIDNINLLICDTWAMPSIKHTRSFFDLFANYMTFSGTEQKKYALDQDGEIKEAKPSGFFEGKAYYPSNKIYFSSKQLEQMYIMEMEDIIKTLKQYKFRETQDS